MNKPALSTLVSRLGLDREAYKIKEAAAIAGVSDSSIRRLVNRGELRAIRKLRHILIPRAELERFLSGAE